MTANTNHRSAVGLLDLGTLRLWRSGEIKQPTSGNHYATEQRSVRAERVGEHVLSDHADGIVIKLLIEVEVLVENNQRTNAARN